MKIAAMANRGDIHTHKLYLDGSLPAAYTDCKVCTAHANCNLHHILEDKIVHPPLVYTNSLAMFNHVITNQYNLQLENSKSNNRK